MFRLHKEMSRLDIPAQRVLRLERSLSDVQVAMPGEPAQEATAYLCSFSSGQGLRVAIALQLHSSSRLAFYLNEEGEVPVREGTRIYNQALGFAESMGFMLGDLDIHLKSAEERIQLWKSLPLQPGLTAPAPAPGPSPKTATPPVATPQAAPAPTTVPAPAPAPATATAPSPKAATPPVAKPQTAPATATLATPAAAPVTAPVAAAATPAAATAPVTKIAVRPQPAPTKGAAASPATAPVAGASDPTGQVPGKVGKPAGPSTPSVPVVPAVKKDEPSAPIAVAGGKSPLRRPAPAELAVKRKELRENLGRFLASL